MTMFETASFHIVKPCNMACKFCYATFNDMKVKEQISYLDVTKILDKLTDAGLQKITFAGGEPLLYQYLYGVVDYAKKIGLTTSIITNGSLLDDEKFECFQGSLDWIGLSVDSLNPQTNNLIGRTSKLNPNYYELIAKIKKYGYKLKINTVVNSYNWDEDMSEFIIWAEPDRWKIFQALRVEGQNEKEFENIRVTETEFTKFIESHSFIPNTVVEDNATMTGSYLLIDPQGRLFENSSGKHTYSKPLQNNTVKSCLSELNLNREMFLQRGGIYNWNKNI